MGSALTTVQFYTHGRRNSTLKGYDKHVAAYLGNKPQSAAHVPPTDPSIDGVDLSGKNVVVTGANSGIGLSIATYCASKRASVFLFCRSKERGDAAAQSIKELTGSTSVECVECDVGDKASIDTAISRLSSSNVKVDSLVCNAGVLYNERRTLPSNPDIEATIGTHLIFGSYYLTKKMMPNLSTTARVVYVSSGGMYNSKFPKWDTAMSKDVSSYNGNLAYVYAKRGQVLLAEELTKKSAADGSKVKFVSSHPGWVDTPAVDAAYGSQKSWLQPMRNTWQGSEGICWLVGGASDNELTSGEFYLDRTVQSKHLNWTTKNSEEEVKAMMDRLQEVAGC